ncbi:MAG TPA: type II secretion system F family protein [Terriglobales bacterium]|nr:type II secretion system F family protein [Terriglobales bacterium]
MLDTLLKLPPIAFAFIAALVVLLAMMALIFFTVLYGPRAKLRKRILSVVGETGHSAKDTRGGSDRRRGVEARLKELERLKKSKRGYQLHEELVQAGFNASPRRFMVLSALFGGVLTLLYFLTGLPRVGVPLVAIIATLGLPKSYLRFKIKSRLKKFTALFADAIDIIVRGVRTGLTVGECLNIVGRESPEPVGTEFRKISEGIHLGLTLEECLNRLYRRVPISEVRFFIIVLIMQQSTGGNLAETLEKLSDIIRARKRMRDKIRALSSEATASAGIIGSLPVLMALVLMAIAPSYIALLGTTTVGHWMLMIGAFWMAIGVMVMRKMINFDY